MSFSHPDFEDHGNPYAAPRAEIGSQKAVFEPTTVIPPTIPAIVSRSLELFRQRMGLCMLVGLGWLVMNIGVSIAVQLFDEMTTIQDPLVKNGLIFALAVLVFLFQTWLHIGLLRVLLKVARDRPAVFGELFSGGPYLLRAIIGTILFMIAVFTLIVLLLAPVVLFGGRGNQQYAAAVLVLIAISFGVYATARLSQFLYAIVDQDAGIVAAFGVSIRITQGQVLRLIAIGILVSLLNACGFLACFVGLLFTAPLSLLILAVAYVSFAAAAGVQPGNVAPKPIAPDVDGVF